MQDIQTIIRAPRCAASERDDDAPCETCPYMVREILPPRYKGLEDGVDAEGNLFSIGCHSEQIMFDAADALEAAYNPKATEGETK